MHSPKQLRAAARQCAVEMSMTSNPTQRGRLAQRAAELLTLAKAIESRRRVRSAPKRRVALTQTMSGAIPSR